MVQKLSTHKMIPVAILAGGLATRMRPLTEKVPKALIEVASEPFIFHQLRYLKQQGINSVVLLVGYLGDIIESFVGDGLSFGLNVKYSFDGNSLLGTGGAIRKALPLLGDEFFVLYGDSFLPVNFEAILADYRLANKLALMTILKNGNRWGASNVLYENGCLISYNKAVRDPKMQYIDYGLGILKSDIFNQHPVDFHFDLADLYRELSVNGNLRGYEVYERFYEIGSIEGLKETEDYFLNRRM